MPNPSPVPSFTRSIVSTSAQSEFKTICSDGPEMPVVTAGPVAAADSRGYALLDNGFDVDRLVDSNEDEGKDCCC